MDETENFSLDIIVIELNLNDKISKDKLRIKVQFDDVAFDILQSLENINGLHEGRSVDFVTTMNKLKVKLVKNPVIFSVYTDAIEENDGLLIGKVTCPWPQALIDKVAANELEPAPFYRRCPIRLEDATVGFMTIANLLHSKCIVKGLGDSSAPLTFDSNGKLEIYNQIKDKINPNDVFFVVGSQSAEEKCKYVDKGEEPKERFPLRLNTEKFQNLQGCLVPNFEAIQNPNCGKALESQANQKAESRVEEGGGKTESEKNGESSTYSLANAPNILPRKKRGILRKKPCRHPRSLFSSDSDLNETENKVVPTLQACYLAECNAKNDREEERKSKPFPNIDELVCEPNASSTIARQQKAIYFRPSDTSIDRLSRNGDVLMHWGEDERTFLKEHGFSKYDHCTCNTNNALECVYCAIQHLRSKQSAKPFHHYIKQDDEHHLNVAEDVCNEVLAKHVGSVERDEHGNRIKPDPDNAPHLTKMLEWLKQQYSAEHWSCVMKRPLRRLAGGGGNGTKTTNKMNKITKNQANERRISLTKKGPTNTKLSSKKGKCGNPCCRGRKSGVLGLKNAGYAFNGGGRRGTKTPKDVKNLLNMNFDGEYPPQGATGDITKCIFDDPRIDSKLQRAIRKLCEFKPETMWTKPPPKPITKAEYIKKIMQKYGRKYCYMKNLRPVHASQRHQTCLTQQAIRIPSKMGWLWTADKEAEKGWRPGKMKKSIREIAQYFLGEFPADTLLTTQEQMALRKRNPNLPPEDLTQKPALQVTKRDGQYFVAMNPLKEPQFLEHSANPYANVQPIQFRISKKSELKRHQAKKCLKSMGFAKCQCGPIANCKCRSFMEREKLERAVENLSALIQQDNLRETVSLGDTTGSDSQLNLEVIPPVALVKSHLVRRGPKQAESTQYDENDFNFKRPVRNSDMILKEVSNKKQRRDCQGPVKPEPCVIPKEIQKKIKAIKPIKSIIEKKESLKQSEVSKSKIQTIKEPSSEKASAFSRPPLPIQLIKQNRGRKRGGADIVAVRRPSIYRPVKKKIMMDASSQTEKIFEKPMRITKPIDRWERYKRSRPVRPPWDDSIYVPPPLTRSSTSPVTSRSTRSQGRNFWSSKSIKNFQNQQARLGRPGCNIEKFEKSTSKISKSPKTTSVYHRKCVKSINRNRSISYVTASAR